MAHLSVTADSAHDDQFTLTVTSTATDADSFSSDSASTSHIVVVTVNAVADSEFVTVVSSASLAEDTAILIPVTVTSGEVGSDPDQSISTSVSGVPAGVV